LDNVNHESIFSCFDSNVLTANALMAAELHVCYGIRHISRIFWKVMFTFAIAKRIERTVLLHADFVVNMHVIKYLRFCVSGAVHAVGNENMNGNNLLRKLYFAYVRSGKYHYKGSEGQ
jgi:hypothetical protein